MVTRNLLTNLARRSTAQCIAGVQGAHQAEAFKHIGLNGGVELLQGGQRQFAQIQILSLRGFDGMCHHFVGIAEGQAFFDQVIGQIGGRGIAFFSCSLHGCSIDADAALFLTRF